MFCAGVTRFELQPQMKLKLYYGIAEAGSKNLFSTSHVIPHIRALVPCPGLTSEVCVVASTSVSLTPTEILFFCRVPDRNTVFL